MKLGSKLRMLFYVGAMLALFGIGLILMGERAAGILLLIAGVSAVVISFSLLKAFMFADIREK